MPTPQVTPLADMLAKINDAVLFFQDEYNRTGNPAYDWLRKDAQSAIAEAPSRCLQYWFVRGYISQKGTIVKHTYRHKKN